MSSRAERARLKAVVAWLEGLDEFSEANERLHEDLAKRILKRIGRRRLRSEQILRIVNSEFRTANAERLQLIADTIRAGIDSGNAIPAAVGATRIAGSAARPPVPPFPDRDASIATGEIMRTSLPFDQLNVAQRLTRRTQQTARGVSAALENSLRSGRSAIQAADRVVQAGTINVDIPQYIERLDAAARAGDPGELRRVIRAEIARLRSSGSLAGQDISKDTRRFIRRVERSQGQDIDNALDEWIRRRAKNQAFTIARTEGVRAQHQASISAVIDKEWAVGMRWNLSGAHPEPDICDMYAGRDEHGLGAGGYPKDAVPDLPHPNCTCYLSPITDPHYQRRQLAIAKGEPEPPKPWITSGGQDGAAWMAAQPEDVQKRILGPGRFLEFQDRPGEVVRGNDIRRLYEIRGERRPTRRRGETARVVSGRRVQRVQRPLPALVPSTPTPPPAPPPTPPPAPSPSSPSRTRRRGGAAAAAERAERTRTELRGLGQRFDRAEITDFASNGMMLDRRKDDDRPASERQRRLFAESLADYDVEVRSVKRVKGDEAVVELRSNGLPRIVYGTGTTPRSLIRARGELLYAAEHGYDTIGTFDARYASVLHAERYGGLPLRSWRQRQVATLSRLSNQGSPSMSESIQRGRQLADSYLDRMREEYVERYFSKKAIDARNREFLEYAEEITPRFYATTTLPPRGHYLEPGVHERRRAFQFVMENEPERDPVVAAYYLDPVSSRRLLPVNEQRVEHRGGFWNQYQAQIQSVDVSLGHRDAGRGYAGYFHPNGGRGRRPLIVIDNKDDGRNRTVETMLHERAHLLDWIAGAEIQNRGGNARAEGVVMDENMNYASFFSEGYWRHMRAYVTREARTERTTGRRRSHSDEQIENHWKVYVERGLRRLRERGVADDVAEVFFGLLDRRPTVATKRRTTARRRTED